MNATMQIPRKLLLSALTLLLLALTVGWLHRQRAFQAGFDGNSDEAAHVVTGLLIRDYLVSGATAPPLKYAERYYVSYPKVAFGVWPPLFHLLEAGWFLLAEPSRFSAMLLMAALLAMTALLLYSALESEMGRRSAAALAVLLVSLPGVTQAFSIVIADGLLIPLVYAATWSFARYLESPSRRESLVFGLLSGLALLTKYNALLLVLVPVVAIAVTRRWSLWRTASLWIGPAAVLAIALPWYALQATNVAYAAEMGPAGFPTRWDASVQNALLLAGFLGPLASVSLLGLVASLRRPSPLAASNAGLLLGTWAMHSLIYPVADPRYLLPAVPALLYFLHAGLQQLSRALGSLLPHPMVARGALLACVSVALYATSSSRTLRPWPALGEQMRRLATTNTMLVGGSSAPEGAVVAEIALSDPERYRRPSWQVLRASKVLAGSSWMGDRYRVLHRNATQVRQALDDWHVSIVVVDDVNPQPHLKLLLTALTGAGATWREHPSAMPRVRVFARGGIPPGPRAPVEIDVGFTLGRKLLY